jgi:hypothetical protein
VSDIGIDIAEEDLVPCRDPDCDGLGEEEVDGNVRYRVCQSCGFEYAYERVEIAGDQEVCAIGVPEELRRAASGPMEQAMAPKSIPLTVRNPRDDNQATQGKEEPDQGSP